jgi:hypothetical protein
MCGRLTMMEKKTFESALTLVLEGVRSWRLSVLKEYGTITSLGTTALEEPQHKVQENSYV